MTQKIIENELKYFKKMRISTKFIIIALIIMIPITIEDILSKDLFEIFLDLITISVNTATVALDIKDTRRKN